MPSNLIGTFYRNILITKQDQKLLSKLGHSKFILVVKLRGYGAKISLNLLWREKMFMLVGKLQTNCFELPFHLNKFGQLIISKKKKKIVSILLIYSEKCVSKVFD